MPHNRKTFIDDTIFKSIIEHTPLVSLDLLVKKRGKVLLGKRINKPARGYWFTIGGRIFKDEKTSDAITRIAAEELGTVLDHSPKFMGVFEHFYDDSIYEGVSTHYINLVYEVEVDDLPALPSDQHDTYRWFDVGELLASDGVHRYVKDIFLREGSGLRVQSSEEEGVRCEV